MLQGEHDPAGLQGELPLQVKLQSEHHQLVWVDESAAAGGAGSLQPEIHSVLNCFLWLHSPVTTIS